MASFDFNKRIGSVFTGILVEGFYTQLNDAFVNEFGEPNENGEIVYERVNAEGGAFVKGVNIELNLVPSKDFTFKSGFTFQRSEYEEAQEFDEKRFFRTPNTYGFIAIDYDIADFCISASGSYTGSMLVPYFGVIENGEGVLVDNIKLNRDSGDFFDLGLKLRYSTRLNGAKLQVFCGVKNLFDAYQNDHDLGVNKDPAYIYGPSAPYYLCWFESWKYA
jgi:outer membrane receptor for ferrienterochelin and colicins